MCYSCITDKALDLGLEMYISFPSITDVLICSAPGVGDKKLY